MPETIDDYENEEHSINLGISSTAWGRIFCAWLINTALVAFIWIAMWLPVANWTFWWILPLSYPFPYIHLVLMKSIMPWVRRLPNIDWSRLDAAGSKLIGRVADAYFQELDIDIPPLEFRSWIPGQERHAQCCDETNTFEQFFYYFCAHPHHRRTFIT